jgi:hypothetical protein
MTPTARDEFDATDDNEQTDGAIRSGAPDFSNRRTRSLHVRKSARRNRSNAVAKRGMHQRRNKRVSW